MPFGLDIKSVIVGALLIWFVLPWVTGLMAKNKTPAAATSY